MSVRTLHYILAADGTIPSQALDGGVQGDHGATEISFSLDQEFAASLFRNAHKVMYRIEAVGGTGTGVVAGPMELSSSSSVINYKLPEQITRYGGVCTITVIFSKLSTELETIAVIHSRPLRLTLTSYSEVQTDFSDPSSDLSTLYQQMQNDISVCNEKYDALSKVAKSGNYSDLSGLPTSIPVGVVVGTLVDGSSNAVSSGAVKTAIDNVINSIRNLYYDENGFYRAYANYGDTSKTTVSATDFAEFCKGIGKFAFCNCTALTQIEIPSGFTGLEEGCFSGCTKLTKIILPVSLNNIHAAAFAGCTRINNITVEAGFNCDLDLSASVYFNRTAAYNIIHNYAENSGKTLTFSQRVYNRLTSSDLTEAANKGLTLVAVE